MVAIWGGIAGLTAAIGGAGAGGAAPIARLVASAADPAGPGAPYAWNLPAGWPTPRVPADNPMTAAKVELGRHLFYDTRLSGNGTQSCSTCHQQAHAFADTRGRGLGSTGEQHQRGSMSLVNVAYAATLTWGNPSLTRLEDQVLVPMFGDHPIELGLSRADASWVDRLREVPEYRRLFVEAFGDAPDPFSIDHVVKALASFERSIVSARSSYDRYHQERDDSAISASARRGETVFFSQPQSCFRCHGGFNFSGSTDFEGRRGSGMPEFHNTGLYNLAGALSYPPGGLGVYDTTHLPSDVGKFKAPTLRNIAVTAPYMHDGSIATLDEVIDHYAAGGRTIAEGPLGGVGHDNPNKSPTVRGFTLTAEQRTDLKAFLASLTDEALLHDPAFADPWAPGSPPSR
jgi:cytochrome c peroxidase